MFYLAIIVGVVLTVLKIIGVIAVSWWTIASVVGVMLLIWLALFVLVLGGAVIGAKAAYKKMKPIYR